MEKRRKRRKKKEEKRGPNLRGEGRRAFDMQISTGSLLEWRSSLTKTVSTTPSSPPPPPPPPLPARLKG